jgi:hypothetical protein
MTMPTSNSINEKPRCWHLLSICPPAWSPSKYLAREDSNLEPS